MEKNFNLNYLAKFQDDFEKLSKNINDWKLNKEKEVLDFKENIKIIVKDETELMQKHFKDKIDSLIKNSISQLDAKYNSITEDNMKVLKGHSDKHNKKLISELKNEVSKETILIKKEIEKKGMDIYKKYDKKLINLDQIERKIVAIEENFNKIEIKKSKIQSELTVIYKQIESFAETGIIPKSIIDRILKIETIQQEQKELMKDIIWPFFNKYKNMSLTKNDTDDFINANIKEINKK